MAERQLTVKVHDEGDGQLWAEVEELPGCFGAGVTLDELWESLREAIGLYLADDPNGARINSAIPTDTVTTERLLVEA